MTEQEFLDKYGSKLNDEQLTAVRTVEGPVLLLDLVELGPDVLRRLSLVLCLCHG